MKIIAVIGLLALAIVGTATAQSMFWNETKRNYRCAGAQAYVICHSVPKRQGLGAYRVMIDGQHLWVSYGGTLIYECWVRRQPVECRPIP